MAVRAIVLTGFGINCDLETAHALRLAGAEAVRVHLNELIERPDHFERAQILAVPGGFSFGDDVASGRILANRLRYRLGGALKQFVADGKLVVGICNGFQVLVKAGILPGFEGQFVQAVTLTHNDSGRFENRWVHLETNASANCIWTKGVDRLQLPVRHGEGKFIPLNDAVMNKLTENGQVVLRYARPDGGLAGGSFPANPNGSVHDVAGLSDPSGRVFGLMPHPEAYVDPMHHPEWTRQEEEGRLPSEGLGLQVFRNAVDYANAL